MWRNTELRFGAMTTPTFFRDGKPDQALYHAKERGRNRVEIASLDLILRLDANTPSLRIDALAAREAAA